MHRCFLQLCLLVSLLFVYACDTEHPPPSEAQIAAWQEEIRQAEADFAAMVRSDGIGPAFVAFADEDGVIRRNNIIYRGKEEIAGYYDARDNTGVELEWAPDRIEVSASGDLAWTYGPYAFSRPDTSGRRVSSTGIFHTVWKRQADGSWKYVWD